jgi:hypothetical protein
MNYSEKMRVIARLIDLDSRALDTADTRHTVDLAAMLRDHIKELSKVEKAITTALTGDVELTRDTDQGAAATIPGINFYANVSETVRWSLDSKAVKAEMGEDWYNARCRQSVVRGVKYLDQ